MHKYLLIPKSQKTYKIRFHFTKQLITGNHIQFWWIYVYFIGKNKFSQDNSHLFAHSFSPKFNLHVRNAWIITRPVINIAGWTISASEYFRNRTNPIFAYSRESTRCHLHTGHSNWNSLYSELLPLRGIRIIALPI